MDINEIRKLYEEGQYKYKLSDEVILKILPLDYVFDENLSVKCNREMVISHNSLVEDQTRKIQAGQADLDRQLTNDIVEYIKENYSLTEAQARLVEMFAYREHHSYMCDYFSYIDTFAKFADDIANISGKVK